MKKIFLTITAALVVSLGYSQSTSKVYRETPQGALDFLLLPMDARSSALGESGVGTSSDLYSHFYNPAKYLFGTADAGVSVSYSPWLRNLVKDMNISSVSGFYRLDELQTISASFRYFSMGDMDFMDEESVFMGNNDPYQLAFDAAYARKLGEHFGASLTFRFAYADLYPSYGDYKKGWGVAADLNAYYNRNLDLFGKSSLLTIGAGLTNIGTKVSFYKDGDDYFMPMNLKLGAALGMKIDEENSISLNGELSHSLVPTEEKDRDKSSVSAMFSSFGKGGLSSIIWGIGGEYGYKETLFARMGYYHESEKRGNRQSLSFGAGVAYKIAHIDIAYIVPTGLKDDAMGNTLRFSIGIDISK